MMCWYCYWGWAKPVAEIYQEAVRRLGGFDEVLLWGPSHIVWSDENFDSAEWCLTQIDEFRDRFSEEELAVCRWSLEELMKLPEDIREAEPEDYDGIHPENYPPKCEVIRI